MIKQFSMNLDEVWIGDKVWIISRGEVGIFEGSEGVQAKIKIGFEHHLIAPDDLSLDLKKEEEIIDFSWLKEDKSRQSKKQTLPEVTVSIDLHIEILQPDLVQAPSARILDYQLAACRQFIQSATQKKLVRVTIIHGIGLGVLKQEVEHVLKGFKEVKFCLPVNQDGALEVWLGPP